MQVEPKGSYINQNSWKTHKHVENNKLPNNQWSNEEIKTGIKENSKIKMETQYTKTNGTHKSNPENEVCI